MSDLFIMIVSIMMLFSIWMIAGMIVTRLDDINDTLKTLRK